MKTHLNHSAEKIKHTIIDNVEKSKDTIGEIIDSANRNMNSALESNKEIVDSFTENLNLKKMDNSFGETLKDTVEKSVELGKDALDNAINSCTKQLEMNVDFNNKLVDAISEPGNDQPAKLLELIRKNVKVSQLLADRNAKEMMDIYNKQINLMVNFNQKIGNSINAQFGSFMNSQGIGSTNFSNSAPEWWKQFGIGKH